MSLVGQMRGRFYHYAFRSTSPSILTNSGTVQVRIEREGHQRADYEVMHLPVKEVFMSKEFLKKCHFSTLKTLVASTKSPHEFSANTRRNLTKFEAAFGMVCVVKLNL